MTTVPNFGTYRGMNTTLRPGFFFAAPSCEYHDGECDCPEVDETEAAEGEEVTS